ncbi:unnamed protein product [Rhizoctonia solani]|uniref:SCP domain-containing protein n=1 Tax=Rhizoctonia solani TaxID=456999 RepID=A0A8H3C019_9AGAM|nr:unnamed protein product [Rhizoctonia solani]
MRQLSYASIFISSLATSACATPLSPVHTYTIRQENDYSDAHNSFRAQHGADGLTWSAELEAKAQNWANGCIFEHGSTGENLAAGTGDFSAAAAVKLWTDEIDQYDPNNPQPSHFTQVVWKSTTQLGCAVARCPAGTIYQEAESSYHVCEYAPPGNVIGEFPENVQK